MGISSSKRKAKKVVLESDPINFEISTIEEVEEQPDVTDSLDLEEIPDLESKIEEVNDVPQELIVEVNILSESTISKIPNEVIDQQYFGKAEPFEKVDEILVLQNEITKLNEEKEHLRNTFSEEYKTKLAEIHGHLQKRLDFLQQEVEENIKAKYEASLKSYDVQLKILERKNKILQDL